MANSTTSSDFAWPVSMGQNISLASGIILYCLLAGCATVSRPLPVPPDQCWTEQEQIRERTRSYLNITESQALDAAERLLRLSGHESSKISRSPHSIVSEFHRKRLIYLVLVAHNASIWEQWIIATKPESSSVGLCVHVHGQYFTDTFVLGAEPVTNAVYPASATERDPGKFFKPPARAYAVDFDTFWARLEYLLGLNPRWASCPPDVSAGIRNNNARGRLEMNPLCHSLADHSLPHTP